MSSPLYQNIYDALLERIKSGSLESGDKLPSERQLRKDFDASETSVRRALAMLEERGYISKRQGSGNFVEGAPPQSEDFDFMVAIPTLFGVDAGLGELRRRLETALPDLNVKTLLLDGSVIEPEDAKRAIARFGKPAILLNSRNQTAAMARLGMLSPLDDLPGMLERFDHLPEHLKWRFPGPDGELRVYGCPYLYTSTGLGLNLDLAAASGLDASKPPRTWGELIEWGRRFSQWRDSVKRFELRPFFCYYKNPLSSLGSFYFMAMNGDPWTDKRSEAGRGVAEFLSFVAELCSGEMLDVVAIQSPDPFVSGSYLFHLQGGSWLPRDVERCNPSLRMKMLPFPTPGPGRPRFSVNGTKLVSLSGAPSDAMAAKLLDTLFDTELSCELAWRFGGLPAVPETRRELVDRDGRLRYFSDAVFTGLEPHCLKDEAIAASLDRLIAQALERPGEKRALEKLAGRHIEESLETKRGAL